MKISLDSRDIVVGRYVWYTGYTSMFSWDCPAVIHRVDPENRVFYVTSLDDVKEQKQAYTFDVNEYSPESRLTMRPVDWDEVARYCQHGMRASEITTYNDITHNVGFVEENGDDACIDAPRQYFLQKWASENGCTVRFMSDGKSETRVVFPSLDEAVLCKLSLV